MIGEKNQLKDKLKTMEWNLEVVLDFKDRQNKRIEHLNGIIKRAIGELKDDDGSDFYRGKPI